MTRTSPSLESEYALLGAAMASPEGQTKLLGLNASDLSNHGCRAVYGAIKELAAKNAPTTPAAIVTRLAQRGELADIGGAPFIFNLFESYDSAGAAGWHVQAIRRDATLRKALDVAQMIEARALEPDADPDKLMSFAVEKLLNTSGSDLDDLAISPTGLMDAMVEQAEREALGSNLTWGLGCLDEHVKLLPGMLVYIGARPKVGKSSLLFQLLQRNCGDTVAEPARGALFSYEMGPDQVSQHLMAKAGYDLGVTLKAAKYPPYDGRWQTAKARVASLDLETFFHNPDMMTLAAQVTALHRVRPFGLVCVDYVGKVASATSSARGIFMDNTQAAVALVSGMLKDLGRRLGFVVVSAVQINRAGADEPELHHLRDSGALEADADAVLLLHRPKADEAEGGMLVPDDEVKVKVAANRMGPASDWMALTYEGRYGLFRDPGRALSLVSP
jgi:replicative DNA helicase